MLKVQHYSISKKLTWMNMLVSGAALLLACVGFCAYDLYTFRAGIVAQLSTEAQILGVEYGLGTRIQRSSCCGEDTICFEGITTHYLRRDLYAGRSAFRRLLA